MGTYMPGPPIAFIALAALLLWFVIDTKRNWFLKFVMIVTVPFLGFSIWNSMERYRGLPTERSLPNAFVLLWEEVHEPNQKKGYPGTIYVLVRDIEKEMKDPQLYKVPYSRRFHEQLEAARKMRERGFPVVFERNQLRNSRDGDDEGNGREDGRERGNVPSGEMYDSGDEFRLYRMPPGNLPKKE